ncbi:hypothetical protein BT96DRAFT_809280, partial [Gymnopus androsaceus JB14]
GYGPLAPCTTVRNFSTKRVDCRKRFLRHPVAQAFIRRKVPFVKEPQLSDVHPSLNNADHLRAYITQAQQSMFPAGTGWEGKLSFASLAKIT